MTKAFRIFAAFKMLRNGFMRFIKEDTKSAKEVCKRNSIVDNLRDDIIKEKISSMHKEDSAIEQNIHVIWISRNLERVAALSTNIAEDVLYMVDGKIIRHHYNE